MNMAIWLQLYSVRIRWRGRTSTPVLPNVAELRPAVTMFLHSMYQNKINIAILIIYVGGA